MTTTMMMMTAGLTWPLLRSAASLDRAMILAGAS
jgi:hypothetical protein